VVFVLSLSSGLLHVTRKSWWQKLQQLQTVYLLAKSREEQEHFSTIPGKYLIIPPKVGY
jgi:hypothetical protein